MATPNLLRSYVTSTTGVETSRTVASVNTSGGSLLLIKVMRGYVNGAETPSSVTFNGSSTGITLHATAGSGLGNAWIYYLNAPASATADVVVTWADTGHHVVIAEVWENTHATVPLKGAATATADTGDTPTVTVTTGAVGDVITDACAHRMYTVADATSTVGDNQTQTQNFLSGSGGTLGVRGSGSYEAGGASVVMSWTLSTSGNAWRIAACPIAASEEGGGGNEGAARYYYNRMMGV